MNASETPTATHQPKGAPWWLYLSILATAVIASYSIYQRYQVESLNKATGLAVEYDIVENLAAAEGKPMAEALDHLKQQGVNVVVLSEETVGDLVYQGQATVQNGQLAGLDPANLERVNRGLSNRFGTDRGPIRFGMVRQTAIGLNPTQADIVRRAGMQIVSRSSNVAGATAEYVRATLTWAQELGASVFLPQGDQVLGRRDALKTTSDTLEALGMLYASPEFTKIGGDANILKAVPGSVIRLHSAQSAELDKLPLQDAVDRYARATRERNMRMLLIRPVSLAADKPLTAFGEFVKTLAREIKKEGGAVGVAKPFEDSGVPEPVFVLLALSVVPTGFFVGSSFVKTRWMQWAGLLILLGLAMSTLTRSGKPLFALLSAVLFPIAAFVVLERRNGRSILLEFLLVTAISLVGGLVVAGLLNALPFFIRAEAFPGVKLAVFLPILVVGAYFLSRLTDLRGTLKSPVTWAAAVMAMVMLGALAFMSLRTGNDAPAGVSDLELRLRSVLDAALLVRPRTKELLIGHPLLIVGIGLLLWQRRTGDKRLGIWTALALAGGAIGQTDIVNTLCHLHTPVTLSLMRVAVGLVFGCIIGLILWVGVKRLLPIKEEG